MKERRWSVNNLADFSGVARGYVSELLNGRKSPTLNTLARLAEGLDVELRDLFAPVATTSRTK